MREADCVGAFIRDSRNRVFAHRRTPTRRLLPGIWDVVGGHVEPGERPEQALAREVEEETGWRLRRVVAPLADWEWEWDGVVRRELDYLVEVDGDLDAPRLEEGKQDAWAWVGLADLELMMVGRTDGDRRLRDLVAKAARTRFTERLRLEPVGPEHAADLLVLHEDPAVAEWYGEWTAETARRTAAEMRAGWEAAGVHKWIAYDGQSGELIGRGGLSRAHVDGADRVELDWAVLGRFWGRGYATEIGRAGLTFGFDDLGAHEVISFTEARNTRSRAVMERLGMRYSRDFDYNDEPFALYLLVGDPARPRV